jgi:transcriptional regulator with XRE-family HTH domain
MNIRRGFGIITLKRKDDKMAKTRKGNIKEGAPQNAIIQKIVELKGEGYGSLKRFAEKVGINPRTLSKAIRRGRTPSVSMVVKISRACNILIGELCKDYITKYGI